MLCKCLPKYVRIGMNINCYIVWVGQRKRLPHHQEQDSKLCTVWDTREEARQAVQSGRQRSLRDFVEEKQTQRIMLFYLKNNLYWAWEVAQQLRALDALTEDSGLIASTHIVQFTLSVTPVPGNLTQSPSFHQCLRAGSARASSQAHIHKAEACKRVCS